MSTPLVGVSMLVKPSPNWKASTVVCRERLMRSANCAMMGMVSAALAEPEGMTMFKRVWKTYMTPTEATVPVSAREWVRP